MADEKEVVQMSSEDFASAFGLLKKLVSDWGLSLKKLFHFFHNIPKDDMVGLLEGTHEILPKQKTVSVDDNGFELVFESKDFVIPDMKTVTADAKTLWRKTLESASIPEGLKSGVKKKAKVFRLKTQKSSQKCLDFVKSLPGAVSPNVFGLRVAETMVGSSLPKDVYIVGFDERDNLSVNAGGFRMVPYLYLNSDGSVNRNWNNWDGDWNVGNYILVFCDSSDFSRYFFVGVFSCKLFFHPPSILPTSSNSIISDPYILWSITFCSQAICRKNFSKSDFPIAWDTSESFSNLS